MAKDKKQLIKEINSMIQVATLAVPRERESHAMYITAAQKAPGELSRRLFTRLAEDEAMHEAKLTAIIKYLEDELARISKEGEDYTEPELG